MHSKDLQISKALRSVDILYEFIVLSCLFVSCEFKADNKKNVDEVLDTNL